MQKRITPSDRVGDGVPDDQWLDLDRLAEVELTSEDASCPIEDALVTGKGPGWRAADRGTQTIRLRFGTPQRIRRIWLKFEESERTRSQEYVVRWSSDSGRTYRDLFRQQWNFSPQGASREIEDHRTELHNVTTLELVINPDISGGDSLASLARMRLA
ncbi:hypothetical protein YTPLAS18_23560 [Nitrospira sp.]|nr:hypothetical protein YTPLAS18_23560 [Nitrospira sp.]